MLFCGSFDVALLPPQSHSVTSLATVGNYTSKGYDAPYITRIAVYLDNSEGAVNEGKSRRKQVAIKFLICQEKRKGQRLINISSNFFSFTPVHRTKDAEKKVFPPT